MGPLTKQEAQNLLDNFRNQLLQRTATKQDVQSLADIVKTLLSTTQQSQQILRQAEYQRSQSTRRIIALETRLAQMEQELHAYRESMNRMVASHSQPPQIVVTPPAHGQSQGQYVYRPA